MQITVAPVDELMRERVLALRVEAAQLAWVGRIDDMLAAADASPSAEPMAILADTEVVGYYRLEYRMHAITVRPPDEPSAGLLGYFIDARRQHHGLGTSALAAVCEDLRTRHPELDLLVLNVGCRNFAAIRVYRHAGFEDFGAIHPGGKSGPQQSMLRRLKPATMRRQPAIA